MNDDVEILPPEGVVEPENERPKKAVSYPVFLVGLLLASALGAAGGGAIAYSLQSDPVNLTPLRNDMAQIQDNMSDLKSAQTTLQNDVKSRPIANDVDLTSIETRLEALENQDPQMIDPDLVARMEELQENGSPAMDLSDIMQRLEALEMQDMSSNADPKIDDILARLTSLENKPEAITNSKTVKASPIVTNMPFPKEQLLQAAQNLEAQGGFLDRMKNKHIRVKDSDDPVVLINAIETAIASGNIEIAKSKFDQLPSTIRNAGKMWRASLDS